MNATTTDLEQLRTDLNSLSAHDLEKKYPKLSTQSLQGLTVEELETRISKSHAGFLIDSLHGLRGMQGIRR